MGSRTLGNRGNEMVDKCLVSECSLYETIAWNQIYNWALGKLQSDDLKLILAEYQVCFGLIRSEKGTQTLLSCHKISIKLLESIISAHF